MNTRSESRNFDDRDYFNRIAHTYDQHRRPGGPQDEVLTQLACKTNAHRVLEIGPGTGNSMTAFIESYPCVPIGVDLSREMLGQAKEKKLNAHWVNGHAEAIPLANESIDFIYSVLAFHHIHDPMKCLQECYRVLNTGICAIVTAPEAFIRTHIMNHYFPSFGKIDLARFQSEHLLEAYMIEAGFTGTHFNYCATPPSPIDELYVEKIANRFISTYALLPDDEFEAGVAHLRRDIAETGQLEDPMIWQSVVVSGHKE